MCALTFYLSIKYFTIFYAFLNYALKAENIREYRCAMRGICGSFGTLHQNCIYDGPPLPVSYNQEHYYRDLCPQLFADDNIAVCCNEEQFDILRHKMTIPQQLLSRCPSCYSNFVNFWCQFTCSPLQYNFVNIVKTQNNSFSLQKNKSYVSHVEYYVNETYVLELFESCKNVRTTNGDYVLSIMCGTNVENCTPEKLFKFLGTFNKALNIPFTIDVFFNQSYKKNNKKKIIPMSSNVFKCNESSDISDYECSCLDCLASCTSSIPFPILFENSCKITMMNCSTAMIIIVVCILFFTTIIIVVLYYIFKEHGKNKFVNQIELSLNSTKSNSLSNKSSTNFTSIFNIEEKLTNFCAAYGELLVNNRTFFFFLGLIPATLASLGILSMRLTTDPVELWSSPKSKAREQRDFFNKKLTPFYRTEHFIVVPRYQKTFEREDSNDFLKNIKLGPVYEKSFLEESFELYLKILALNGTTEEGEIVTLNDICYKPLAPQNNNCAVFSIFNYFQNNKSNLHRIDDSSFTTYDYVDHLLDCVENPYTMNSKLKLSCFGNFGGPIYPYIVLGDFGKEFDQNKISDVEKYKLANGLVIIILIKNFLNEKDNQKALIWEKVYISFMRSIHNYNFTISFMAERSLQDEIKRQSSSDVLTVVMSYLFMFIYVAFALGQYQVSNNNLCSLFINSKFLVGICGILSVTLSVLSSIGLLALYNIPASLLILEVEPFLVLAVGIDNIFIFVQSYQRLSEEVNKPLTKRVSIMCSEVMPSMFLSSLSECLCFCIGALSEMPAVQAFSLYAALAIILNFFLQITLFLSVFIWDIQRQEQGRLEFCCCVKMQYEATNQESFMYKFFKKYYAPFLLRKSIRSIIIIIFALWLTSSVMVLNQIKPGLDQKMAVPEDSYVLTHFINMDRFLSVGPAVYFVIQGSYDFEEEIEQSLICSSVGCSIKSLGAQIATAAKYPERSYIALPVMNWVDDYVDWLKPLGMKHCCRQFISNSSFCSSEVKTKNVCKSCDISFINGRPNSTQFYKFLPNFLQENPSMDCTRAGHAAYNSAVQLDSESKKVIASHYMTYHTVLKTSEDYIRAMKSAFLIARNITRDINEVLLALRKPPIEIFPYSPFYVFYEQYQDIVYASIVQITLSLASIFCVTTILLGMDLWSAFIIVIVIAFILINIIGLMYWWSIDLNAISLVNLVMSIGISVEFCAHIVQAFATSLHKTRVERASEALSKVGCSVLSGIILTKLGEIIVLAFAHSQIFNVYYFRMFLGIVFIGATHGLILLPILLSICGPPLNKYRTNLKELSDNKAKLKLKWLPPVGKSVEKKIILKKPSTSITEKSTLINFSNHNEKK